jgi:hypothetical protein
MLWVSVCVVGVFMGVFMGAGESDGGNGQSLLLPLFLVFGACHLVYPRDGFFLRLPLGLSSRRFLLLRRRLRLLWLRRLLRRRPLRWLTHEKFRWAPRSRGRSWRTRWRCPAWRVARRRRRFRRDHAVGEHLCRCLFLSTCRFHHVAQRRAMLLLLLGSRDRDAALAEQRCL